MEDTLRGFATTNMTHHNVSLNPYYNGRYSTSKSINLIIYVMKVLILIIMEYTLRAQQKPFRLQRSYVLILIIMEYTLREVILYSTNYQHIKLIKLI